MTNIHAPSSNRREPRSTYRCAVLLLAAVPLITLIHVGLGASGWHPVMTPASWSAVLLAVVVFPFLGHVLLREHLGTLLQIQNCLIELERGHATHCPLPPDAAAGCGDSVQSAQVMTDLLQHGRKKAEVVDIPLWMRAFDAHKFRVLAHLARGLTREMDVPLRTIEVNTRVQREILNDYHHALLAASAKGADAAPAPPAIDRHWLEKTYTELQGTFRENAEGAERIERVVNAIGEFAADDRPGRPRTIDLNRAIESAVDITRNEWKHIANVITDLDPALPLLTCHHSQIKQAILNLLLNASQAVAKRRDIQGTGKGLIKITTWCDRGWISMRIRDTGCGIGDETRPHIFEPFLSTLRPTESQRHGLSLTHAIVAILHGGNLLCDSKIDVGSTFTVKLPLGSVSPNGKEGEMPPHAEWRKNNELRPAMVRHEAKANPVCG